MKILFSIGKIKGLLKFALLMSIFALIPFLLFYALSADNLLITQSALLTCKVSEIHFPVVLHDYFSGDSEIEPNNSVKRSTGPLLSGVTYLGTYVEPLNYNVNDYYRFYNPFPGHITVMLEGVPPITDNDLNTRETQLQLVYRGDNFLTPPPISTIVSTDSPPYQITHRGEKGWYIVFIHAPYHTMPQNITYSLKILFPSNITQTQSFPHTSVPFCTPTLTPSPTPSITPSHTPQTTACEFEPISAGFSVLFPTGTAGHIWANDKEDDAITTAVSLTPIAPGSYQVTMYSYDNHTAKPDQIQPTESWYLRLKDASGTVIATAGPSMDIPDGAGNDCQPTYLEDLLILTDTAVFAEAYHAAYRSDNPNSVNPDYALLVPVRMVAPLPTQTPRPPHLVTPTPTP